MLEAYFDDAGKMSDHHARFVVMAGYFADHHFWNQFRRDFTQHCLRLDISSLHTTQLMAQQGEYADWTEEKLVSAVASLIASIRKANLVGIGVAVDAEAWRRLVPPPLIRAHGDAQLFCFERTLKMVIGRLQKADPLGFLVVTFDHDYEYGASRLKRYVEMRKRLHQKGEVQTLARMYAIAFASARTCFELQAADLLAWSARRTIINHVTGKEPEVPYAALLGELDGVKPQLASELWDEQEIQARIIAPAVASGKYGLSPSSSESPSSEPPPGAA